MTSPKKSRISFHPAQEQIAKDETRFKVVASGRRWGKSYLGIELAMKKVFKQKNKLVWIICPTREMAKDIHWDHLLQRCKDLHWKIKKNETSLSITRLLDGSKIILKTADNPDRLRGRGLDLVVIDEFRDMEQWIWGDVLRPALTDKKGDALFISTPNGKDVLYDLYLKGLNNETDWKSWHYKTIDSPFIDASEVEQAKRDLDLRTYKQEYEADFDTGGNSPYYAYTPNNHKAIELRQDLPFILACDFNATTKPMSWIFGQRVINNIPDNTFWKKTFSNKFIFGQRVINNISDNTFWKKTFSNKFTNTQTQCEIVWEYFQTLPDISNSLFLYGDYTGKNKESNSSFSDWEIITNFFRNKFTNIEQRTKPTTSIRDSISSTNAQLCNTMNERKMFVDEVNCKELIEDWNKCEWKANGRELDESNDDRGHMCRAVDYYNDYEHPIKGKPEVTWSN